MTSRRALAFLLTWAAMDCSSSNAPTSPEATSPEASTSDRSHPDASPIPTSDAAPDGAAAIQDAGGPALADATDGEPVRSSADAVADTVQRSPTDAAADPAAPTPGTTPPITPRWAFEPWVWEDNTNTRASTETLVADYVSRQIPVGA